MLSYLLILLLILLLAALFSAAGSAFTSSNHLQFKLETKKRNITERILDLFYARPDRYLFFTSTGLVISWVCYTYFLVNWLTPYLSESIENCYLLLLTLTLIGVVPILLFGEFIPKMLVRINPNTFFTLFSIPLYLFYIILFPVYMSLIILSKGILALFGVKLSKENQKSLGREELDQFIQQTIDESSDDAELDQEMRLFQNAMDFSTQKVRDCMVPRTEINTIEKEASVNELVNAFVRSGHSKLVVINEDVDNIVGYIHSSELFVRKDDWQESIVELPFVPENMAANKLMKNMLSEKNNMAVVVDEFGGTTGIITLEDLVEEIFGEIEDEHDKNKMISKQINDKEYILSGRMEIDQVNEKFDLELPESDEYKTIAGLILNVHQTFPKVNEIIETEAYSFRIIKVTHTKIELVRLTLSRK